MLANDLADKIKTLAIGDVPVQVAFLDATADIGIMVKPPLDGLTSTPEMPAYVKGPYQVIVRHTDPLAGDALARLIQDGLTVLGAPDDLATYRIVKMWPVLEPIMYPINDAGLFEHSVNFQVYAIRL